MNEDIEMFELLTVRGLKRQLAFSMEKAKVMDAEVRDEAIDYVQSWIDCIDELRANEYE